MCKHYKEIYTCKEGEFNGLTREIFCKARREFCNCLGICPMGYVKEETEESKKEAR